jgi:hypothetical protein
MKRLVSALLAVMIAPHSSALLADEEGKEAMKYQQEQQRELRKNREAIKDWEEAEREARKDWEEAEGKARKGRQEAVNTMAHGGYHPKNGADGEEKAVKTEAKSGVLEEFDSGLAGGAPAAVAVAVAGEKSTAMSTEGEESIADLVGQEKSRSETSSTSKPLDYESEERNSEVKPIELVGEAMICSESYELKSKKGEKETWLIYCGDGESLKAICVGGIAIYNNCDSGDRYLAFCRLARQG